MRSNKLWRTLYFSLLFCPKLLFMGLTCTLMDHSRVIPSLMWRTPFITGNVRRSKRIRLDFHSSEKGTTSYMYVSIHYQMIHTSRVFISFMNRALSCSPSKLNLAISVGTHRKHRSAILFSNIVYKGEERG